MENSIVHIDNVCKFFDGEESAICDICTTIPEGKITGIAGPDGAGKTTLIRLITSLMIPDKGNISISGYDTVMQPHNINLITGYMPQKFGLYEDLTVLENLQLYADLRNVTGEDRKIAFERLLTFTDLKRFVNRLAGNLSGGMKQKLGLACSLINKPKLLLLDEPSVGIDPVSRRELWNMVKELVNEGITVVWSTAYLDEAEKCDNVLLLNQGKLIYDGTPQTLTEQVANRVYQIRNIEGRKRVLLTKILDEKGVIDGVIQGSFIRIVLDKNNEKPDINKIGAGDNAYIAEVQPRFEDAFIDILGGGPGGHSELAERIPMIEDYNRPVIEANNLTKMYGDFAAAKDISFSINRGEIFGLLGPNGAGKSTTFKMMCGLLVPSLGTARVMGLDLQKCPGKARSYIGYMAQKFSLYENLSVMQNLQFFSGIYGLTFIKKREKINEMIDIFNMKKFLDSNAGELPLGYKQRLALACAVMHNPSVIFLDEPTSGVDPITRREFWTHINNVVEKGVTVMVTTHFMDEAEYCDRISLVYRGKTIATGSPDDLKNSVRSEDLPEPTMEDTFISLIKSSDLQTEEVA